jgi:hypothetical protein
MKKSPLAILASSVKSEYGNACQVYCYAHGLEACESVAPQGDICKNLYKSANNGLKIVNKNDAPIGWDSVTIVEAFDSVKAPGDDCAGLCEEIPECRNSTKGSYCKKNNQCFGMFWSDLHTKQVCFQPGDKSCDQFAVVLCSVPDEVGEQQGRSEGAKDDHVSTDGLTKIKKIETGVGEKLSDSTTTGGGVRGTNISESEPPAGDSLPGSSSSAATNSTSPIDAMGKELNDVSKLAGSGVPITGVVLSLASVLLALSM